MNSQIRGPEREYIQGESHWYQGHWYLLNIIEENSPPEVSIRNKSYIDLYVRPGSDKVKREEVIKQWYRDRLKEEIPAMVKKWENKLGVTVSAWGVKQMKTTSNGLLLRSDMHILFDKGYTTVTDNHYLEVSRHIREEFEKGREYYDYCGIKLSNLR